MNGFIGQWLANLKQSQEDRKMLDSGLRTIR